MVPFAQEESIGIGGPTMVAPFVNNNGDAMPLLSAEATPSSPVRLGRGCSARYSSVCAL